jgi:hypothetical protein
MPAVLIQSRQWFIAARSIVIRHLRHRNLAPQCWPFRELFDRLLKCLALIVGHDCPEMLEALADDIDRSAGHHRGPS